MYARLGIVFICSFVACAQAAVSQGCENLRELSTEIDKNGASATLRALYKNQERWGCLLDGLASGAPSWLAIAVRLRPASDAGSTSELEDAMVLAFERNPKAVFPLLRNDRDASHFTIPSTCNPGLEPRGGYTAFFDRVEAKLTKLESSALNAKVQQCLAIVRAARSEQGPATSNRTVDTDARKRSARGSP